MQLAGYQSGDIILFGYGMPFVFTFFRNSESILLGIAQGLENTKKFALLGFPKQEKLKPTASFASVIITCQLSGWEFLSTVEMPHLRV